MSPIDPEKFGKLYGNVETIMERQSEDRDTRKDMYKKINKNTTDIARGKVIFGIASAVVASIWAWIWKQI